MVPAGEIAFAGTFATMHPHDALTPDGVKGLKELLTKVSRLTIVSLALNTPRSTEYSTCVEVNSNRVSSPATHILKVNKLNPTIDFKCLKKSYS
jgi:hypothetical protein